MIVCSLSASLCREQFRSIPKLHSLSQSGIHRIYRRYILPPILYFVFIVDFYTTIVSAHSICYGWIYLWWLTSLSWEHIGTAVLICPLLIVGSFALGRNTTDDCFISLPDTTNFHLSVYHSLLILILGLWLFGLLSCYCFFSLTLHIWISLQH